MSKKAVAQQKKQLPTETKVAVSSARPTRAELAKIHIAKRDLKLTDQLYRGVLNVLFGETSAKDLSHKQIDELLTHFKSLGWESDYSADTKKETGSKNKISDKPVSQVSPSRGPATMAQLGLIMYLWKHGPGIRNKSTEALDYFLNHHFHVSEFKEVKARQVPGILGAIRKMARL